MSSLAGKVCVVTGASRGIGRAIALTFARAGAKVGLIARNAGPLAEVGAEIRAAGGACVIAPADVTDPAAIARAADVVRLALGPPDVVVNDAGLVVRRAALETTDDEWRRVIATNLDGTFFVIRAFGPDLIARRGRIINIASRAGREGTPMLAAYCAAKHGVVGLTRALAEELRGAKVCVNAICPGSVDTEMLREGIPGAEPDMTPDDIARTALYLAADAPAALTGSCIDIFGVIPMRDGKGDSHSRDKPEHEPIHSDALAQLPIFPLPNCVLLPGGLLPLHVFEPRYRELTRDCLADSKLLAIARLQPGHEAAYFGRPPVNLNAGLGRIICSDELADGRFHILLRGVGRVRIVEELDPERSYRRVRATLLEDHASKNPDAVRAGYAQLVQLCDRLADVLDEGGDQLRDLVKSQTCAADCADVLTAALVTDPDDRQALLEALDPADRLERAIAHVGRLLCELAPVTGEPN